MAKVAFLGLGVMGYPMAGHLQKKGGHEVTVYNRTAAKAEQWVKEYGGKRAGTPRRGGEGLRFRDDVRRQRRRRALGGLSATTARSPGMKKGAILVDHTTASAIVAREAPCKGQAKGHRLRRRAGLRRPGRRA